MSQHITDIETASTWQAGTLYRASCSCAQWQGQWVKERCTADAEGGAHVLRSKGIAQAIVNEIRATLNGDRKVAFIRVTPAAVSGSAVAVSLPTDPHGLEVEILVHPSDWQLLAFESLSGAEALKTESIFGVSVLHDD